MAIRGPFTRWRLVEPVRDMEDVTKIFRELEDAYERMVYVLEQGSDDAPGTAPGDAEYILGVADVDLPNGRVLVNGQNTTADLGTPGEASIDVPDASTTTAGVVELATNGQVAAGLAVQANDGRLSNARTPTGPAGGDLAGTYPNPTVDGIQGNPVQGLSVTDGDAFEFSGGQWNHVQIGGDLDGSPSAAVVTGVQGNPWEAGTPAGVEIWQFNAIAGEWRHVPTAGDVDLALGGGTTVVAIQNNPVESGTPTAGDVYRWDGSEFVRWSPKYMTATLSTNQTTNIGNGNHVEFDTASVDSGHIVLSTGAGQADGIFSLPEGVYELTAVVSANFTAANGVATLRWAVAGGGLMAANDAELRPPSSSSSLSRPSVSTKHLVVGPAGLDAELRINGAPTSLQNIHNNTFVTITALA